ncbi:MAG: hypothetical protein JST42_13965 [Bacteroidetes bacterium]|nr:hypothetical protein [Bacteroidota bacterium]
MNCKALIHPFQYDTGTSQTQRIMEDLLEGPAQLDGRTIADMLGYFVKFSRQINFYDEDLSIKNWQPFFRDSLPFIAASILNFRQDSFTAQVTAYQKKFLRRPTKAGLDILVDYIYRTVISPLDSWNTRFRNTGLPVGPVLDGLIKKNLPAAIRTLIIDINTGVKCFRIRPVDFSGFSPAWGLTPADLTATLSPDDFQRLGRTRRDRLIALYDALSSAMTPFLKAINSATGAASLSLQQSFESLKEELRQRHQPHLALIFAFLNLFRHLQDNLNNVTKSHLDFFYRQVLALQPKGATPDKAHIVLTIQKQLSEYRLAKGVNVKGPKDAGKADILFGLDDEIVVNQAQVTDIRTLYVNDQPVLDQSYIQGVYMAPNATKADGIDKDFKAGEPNSWPTLGDRYSKYTDPDRLLRAYPNARLAFVLASPVLLLNEGSRTVTVTFTCTTSPIFDLAVIYQAVRDSCGRTYYYINQDLIKQAVKAGIDPATETQLRALLPSAQYEVTVDSSRWPSFTAAVLTSLQPFFPPQRSLAVAFSGDKDWITPKALPTLTLSDLTDTTFSLTVVASLDPEEPAVTFYNKDALKEDINTTQPAARVSLNDKIKIYLDPAKASDAGCCLRPPSTNPTELSLYHFFRNVTITDTHIDVRACGIKKFVVQNDESLQDVNKPIYPFGTRPTIIDFDIVTEPQLPNPPEVRTSTQKNLIGPNFYIGSQEIFCKKWTSVNINLNWKDKPSSFNEYYRAYWVDPNDPNHYGLDADGFHVNVAALQQQGWLPESADRKLFDNSAVQLGCSPPGYQQTIGLSSAGFPGLTPGFHIDPATPLTKYEAATMYGFVRVNLRNQDFLQKDYAYVLARQMMALSKLSGKSDGNNDELRIENAVYYSKTGEPIVFSSNAIRSSVDDIGSTIDDIHQRLITDILPNVDTTPGTGISPGTADDIRHGLYTPGPGSDFRAEVEKIQADVASGKQIIDGTDQKQAIIPNEPWTPIIQGISLDYSATAAATDIDLIHLYPFAGTYKKEELTQSPQLFPAFFDEGTLFLGIDGLLPGSDINILFQLAEATSDTEEDPVPLEFSYLEHNVWKPLRKGFEILDDATGDLSTSGIIKIAIPDNITNDNTVMPAGHWWIKAAISSNSKIVAETFHIHTQAIRATFTEAAGNDEARLSAPLAAGSLGKLEVADANVKKVEQPYDSFGGRLPETDGYFYVRVSETLRHKGRAIQRCDYERIALDAFPQLFKAKCINHSIGLNAHKYTNDYPMAPGYVLMAVIPDLNQLKASATFEPRAPLSLLEQLEQRMQQVTSPFVRFRAMNPRYEKVDFVLRVKLLPGKDPVYYQQRLSDDIREFMAPWAVGEFDKLRFGQVVNRSDVIRFLETRDYLDYVIDWKWRHEEDETVLTPSDQAEIFPITPRSILIAGNIDITIVRDDCPKWEVAPASTAKIYKNE